MKHATFGRGEVLSIEGDDSSRKAKISFETSGERVLLLKYAKLELLK